MKFVREGNYVAEVEVDLIQTDKGWSPYLSLEDAEKLDAVREALRQGEIEKASEMARVLRIPSTGLFVSTDPKLGDESELFKELSGARESPVEAPDTDSRHQSSMLCKTSE